MRRIPKLRRKCGWCQTEFLVNAWKVRQGGGRFCSRRCALNQQMADGIPGRPTLDPRARFLERIDQSGGDQSCWVWTWGAFSDGYGQIKVNNKPMRAHRLSWILFRGPIPDGMDVLHTCDNPPCVNPNHLFLGTDLDNQRDRRRKGR